jgi:predicted nucleotidyltransferase
MKIMITDQIINNAARLNDEIGLELAFGLSGSQARGTADARSDIDICVFIEGDYPSRETRQVIYAILGLRDPFYFDVDFGTSRGDGFTIDGIRCDFNWMVLDKVQEFLGNLSVDFDCPEWLPGGLESVKGIYDPGNVIIFLQDLIPAYPIERSRHRVQRALKDADYALYKLEWLEKAAHRGDTYSFLKNQYLLLEKFFYAIFALNRTWFSDEKGLIEKVMNFKLVPLRADQRIQATILHEDRSKNLAGSLREIESLFRDTAVCVEQVYPNLDIPTTWDR